MAWGAKCGYSFQGGDEGFGMGGLVRSASFGRKRVALTSNDVMGIDAFDKAPIKRLCSSEASVFTSEKSRPEELPQDVLLKIVCGVEHDDLKMLFFVSKSIREATVIAKHSHFLYKTPRKTIGFVNAIDLEDSSEFNEFERAPKQARIPRSLDIKKLSDISVALFTPAGEEKWARRELFMEMETDL